MTEEKISLREVLVKIYKKELEPKKILNILQHLKNKNITTSEAEEELEELLSKN